MVTPFTTTLVNLARKKMASVKIIESCIGHLEYWDAMLNLPVAGTWASWPEDQAKTTEKLLPLSSY